MKHENLCKLLMVACVITIDHDDNDDGTDEDDCVR